MAGGVGLEHFSPRDSQGRVPTTAEEPIELLAVDPDGNFAFLTVTKEGYLNIFQPDTYTLLNDMVRELKILNVHMEAISGERVQAQDVEV